ncbi:MAG: hypothetical protein ACYC8T_32920 [Myxococcaceae bacterium]
MAFKDVGYTVLPFMPFEFLRRFGLAALLIFVLGTGAAVEVMDWMCGRSIRAVNEECAENIGSCKWRVARGDELGSLLRSLAFFPGLLVYPAAPLAAGLFVRSASRARSRSARIAGWCAAAATLVVLGRFVWLGVFRAVTQ